MKSLLFWNGSCKYSLFFISNWYHDLFSEDELHDLGFVSTTPLRASYNRRWRTATRRLIGTGLLCDTSRFIALDGTVVRECAHKISCIIIGPDAYDYEESCDLDLTLLDHTEPFAHLYDPL